MANLLNQQKYFRDVIVPAALKSAGSVTGRAVNSTPEIQEITDRIAVNSKTTDKLVNMDFSQIELRILAGLNPNDP